MKINTNSNVYTVVYASLVVVVVAFLLAFVSKALEPTSMSNERIDKKKQILASLNIRDLSNDKVESEYDKSITYDKIIRTAAYIKKVTIRIKTGLQSAQRILMTIICPCISAM